MPRTDFASALSEDEIGRLADAALADLTRRLAARVFEPTDEPGDGDALGRLRMLAHLAKAIERRAAEEAAAAAAAGARYPQLGDAWYVSRQAARQRWPGLVFAAVPESRPLPRLPDRPGSVVDYDVLLVEDDLADGIIIEEGLREQGTVRTVTRVDDGLVALDFLRRPGAARPSLIVVDLNVPRMSGRELLAALRDDRDLRAIPVVVLTNSSDPHDVSMAFDLHANAYVTKPVKLDEFQAAVRGIDAFFRSA